MGIINLLKPITKNKIYLSIFFIILFTGLYRIVHYIENIEKFNMIDYLHFSLITQSTVGYGSRYEFIESNLKSNGAHLLFKYINMLQLCSILYIGLL